MQWIHQIHLWCNACWPFDGQHGSRTFLIHLLVHFIWFSFPFSCRHSADIWPRCYCLWKEPNKRELGCLFNLTHWWHWGWLYCRLAQTDGAIHQLHRNCCHWGFCCCHRDWHNRATSRTEYISTNGGLSLRRGTNIDSPVSRLWDGTVREQPGLDGSGGDVDASGGTHHWWHHRRKIKQWNYGCQPLWKSNDSNGKMGKEIHSSSIRIISCRLLTFRESWRLSYSW